MNLSSEVFLVVSIVFILTYLLYSNVKKQKKIALNGYDLVAYFEINQAVKGKKKYRVFYKPKHIISTLKVIKKISLKIRNTIYRNMMVFVHTECQMDIRQVLIPRRLQFIMTIYI